MNWIRYGRKCGMRGTGSRLRIFCDTNVLISAVLSEKSVSAQLFEFVIEEHDLLICSYSIVEASRVIERKFPQWLSKWDEFLTALEFEITYTPKDLSTVKTSPIRDQADLPILVSAIVDKANAEKRGLFVFRSLQHST